MAFFIEDVGTVSHCVIAFFIEDVGTLSHCVIAVQWTCFCIAILKVCPSDEGSHEPAILIDKDSELIIPTVMT